MKKIAFCFDGTWNRIESDYVTNVARIAQSISRFDQEGNRQIVHYDEGVGTSDASKFISAISNRLSGAFGLGLRQNIIEAYTFLVLNYEPGDKLYVFGFSRGAFTARSFIGLLRNSAVMAIMPLTTQDVMLQDSGQAGAATLSSLEISPAMRIAGLNVLETHLEHYAFDHLVSEIYIAMSRAKARENQLHKRTRRLR